ncbi:MAG: type II toxin-antitoxin system VapC family toxin [Candidatus Nitrospinota bacterium M3_3B_026]
MNLVDSCGWLEYYADGPGADFFAPAIENVKKLLVPSICVLEVFKRVYLQKGEDAALIVVAAMRQGHVVDLDDTIALNAAKLGADIKIPLADSVILATARQHDAVIWTSDSDFKGIEGVKFLEKTPKKRRTKN